MMRTDVLVVGGGPAGATAARILAQHGIGTIIAERDLSYRKPCGGAIPSPAFQEFSVPSETIRKRIRTVRIVSPRGTEVDVALTGGHLCITERGRFDAALREMAIAKGASLIEAEFLGFEATKREITSLVKKRDSGEHARITSRYLIAADGITGRVASLVQRTRPNFVYTMSAQVRHDPGRQASSGETDRDQKAGDGAPPHCEFWFGMRHARNFYSWVFPSEGYASVGTGSTDPKELGTLFRAFLERRSTSEQHHKPMNDTPGRRRIFKIPQWRGAVFHEGNILFVGDAAGLVLPVIYEGIYYAMKSGEFAARAIAEGNPAVYCKLWNRGFRNRFLVMATIKNHLFRNDETIEKWVRLHTIPEVQELAMGLWLRKESGTASLFSYMKCFRHLL